MSLIKKIVELAERSDSIDAKKQVAKLSKEVKGYKERVIPEISFSLYKFVILQFFEGSKFN